MIGKGLIICLLAALPLGAAPKPEALAIQELRSLLQEVHYKVNAQMTDLRLFEERLSKMESKVEQAAARPSSPTTPKRDEDLAADLRLLKKHLEKTQTALTACEKRVSQLDKQLDKDIGSLKSSLSSMLALLKGDESGSGSYTVQPGDSLGLIAIRNKTSTKRLKELNHLSSDTIFPGQKLTLP